MCSDSLKFNKIYIFSLFYKGKTKTCAMPANHFGPIPGIEVGMCWRFRIQVNYLLAWDLIVQFCMYLFNELAKCFLLKWLVIDFWILNLVMYGIYMFFDINFMPFSLHRMVSDFRRTSVRSEKSLIQCFSLHLKVCKL